MAFTDYITINIEGHGTYQTRAGALDLLMQRYLPASIAELRAKIEEKSDGNGIDYSDLSTVTECLMILGEYDGYATN